MNHYGTSCSFKDDFINVISPYYYTTVSRAVVLLYGGLYVKLNSCAMYELSAAFTMDHGEMTKCLHTLFHETCYLNYKTST